MAPGGEGHVCRATEEARQELRKHRDGAGNSVGGPVPQLLLKLQGDAQLDLIPKEWE